MTETATELSYLVLTGPQFNRAVQGAWEDGRGVPATLASPRLKYYMQRSSLVASPDRRALFIATSAPSYDDSYGCDIAHAVGMLELEVSPYDDAVVWLKYITVHPDFLRQGIARQLLDLMVEHLKANPRKLERSRPSEEGALKIKAYIDSLLHTHGLLWTQSGS